MKNLLRCTAKIAKIMPIAVAIMWVSPFSAIAQVDTSAASQGNENNTNNMATGSQALQGYSNMGDTSIGRYGSYGGNLQTTRSAYQAPYSTNSAALPSGQFSYGFTGNAFSGLGSAATGGQYLPTTSTSSNDLNIVDNSNYGLSGGILNNLVGNAIESAVVPLVNNAVVNTSQALQGLNSLFGD